MSSAQREKVRLAELIAAISLATDLGSGQPMEHALRTCYLATGLAREIGLPIRDLFDTYYVSLLRFLGCTAEASMDAALNGGDDLRLYEGLAPVLMGRSSEVIGWMLRHLAESNPPLERGRALVGVLSDPKAAERSIRAHCEVGQMLTRRIGLGDSVLRALGCAFERWDGKGLPNGIAGEAIPPSCRVAIVARDFDLLNRVLGRESATEVLQQRRGRAYEPRVLDAALEHGHRLLGAIEDGAIWDAILAAEPTPPMTVHDAHLDNVLNAFARFVDLKSPYLLGHSVGVADLVEQAAMAMGMTETDATLLKRAGLLHDLGRVAVPSGIWNKRGRLSDEEWERVRLHSYFTERILTRSGPLSGLSLVASSHHERMDGSGYHRRVDARSLSAGTRLLAAADAFRAMTETRPHRDALARDRAAGELNRAAAEGALDVQCVRAVLEVGGEASSGGRASWPAGLTDREVEVLRLLASGLSNKQMARKLTLSPKTVGHHIEHIYAKIEVSTRAGATLYAMEQGLLGA